MVSLFKHALRILREKIPVIVPVSSLIRLFERQLSFAIQSDSTFPVAALYATLGQVRILALTSLQGLIKRQVTLHSNLFLP
jgi:hypothetical protein